MSRLAASVKIFLSSYDTPKSAQQDYSRNKDSKREPGDLLSCFTLNWVLFCMRWSVWMCLFQSGWRDGILSASHFTTHRNHPTEDDDQDARNEIPGNSNDGGRTGKANGRVNGWFWLWFTWTPPSLELHISIHFSSHLLILFLSLYFFLFFKTGAMGQEMAESEYQWMKERGEWGVKMELGTHSEPRVFINLWERDRRRTWERERKRRDLSTEIFFRWFEVQFYCLFPSSSSQASSMMKQLCIFLPSCRVLPLVAGLKESVQPNTHKLFALIEFCPLHYIFVFTFSLICQ